MTSGKEVKKILVTEAQPGRWPQAKASLVIGVETKRKADHDHVHEHVYDQGFLILVANVKLWATLSLWLLLLRHTARSNLEISAK
jgi:hypothetical protein